LLRAGLVRSIGSRIRAGNTEVSMQAAAVSAPRHGAEPDCLKRVDLGDRYQFQAAVSRAPPIAKGAMPCRTGFLPKTIMPAVG
jgi:hypothetical protein